MTDIAPEGFQVNTRSCARSARRTMSYALAVVTLGAVTLIQIATAPSASAGPGTTTRVSVSSAGEQTNNGSQDVSMSADGRFVAFGDAASNLVPNDTNDNHDVFVHDRLTSETSRVSVGTGGAQLPFGGGVGAISGNGRYVAFLSGADQDIYVHDRVTGETTGVSVATTGGPADGDSGWQPAISFDGRFVVFMSEASNLVPDDTNDRIDLFLRDRLLGTTQRVNVSSSGGQSLGGAADPVISADGRFVGFGTAADDLVPDDTNGQYGGYVHDRVTGVTSLVTVSSGGEQANAGCDLEFVSADGRLALFDSSASNLVAGDTNGQLDGFLHDRLTGETVRVTLAPDGSQILGGYAYATRISDDSRLVLFASEATNLVPGDTNDVPDVFIQDRVSHETVRVSVASDGTQANDTAGVISMSADGRVVAFASVASNLVPGDTNDTIPNASGMDVFVHDLGAQSTTRTLTAGESVTSDTEGDGATVFDPVETSITTPNAGTVSMDESLLTEASPPGFTLLGRQVLISAPPAGPEAPLALVFRLDASIIPEDQDETSVVVFKNGVGVAGCTGPPGVASPDPCLSSRTLLADGDVELGVLTATASTWTFGIGDTFSYSFSGFLPPVDNPPTVNVVKAGRAVPVEFSLNGNQGLDILVAGSPASQPVHCDTTAPLDAIEETVTAGSSSLSYDATLDRYTYVWKTAKDWTATCRNLILKLADGTDRTANFKFMK